ncbi:helix-hairpin-helix domain-containing protein [Undibacterium sp. CY21W]|uniref:helix-hairpin-helix domain-containing protein n=1 Tax=Undibacterium sp. CY21W TaxID=2762293 RepID=UPI00164B2197|nr:helix-hairpin-helix domain-containing protein [Undibacterium sp. CY21W]MBC3928612.1 helix-hairpin-helix domain-containing protein [Undibacterium sp. CY21W]
MHPDKVDRNRLRQLTDLPNIGKAGAADLRLLGINAPADLVGQCPWQMYEKLCQLTGVRHDPCVIDVFMSVTAFMNGEPAKPWWEFTDARKLVQAEKAAS